MGEDCKAKIEVVLNNEDRVEMYLNGKTTTLQNMATSVMTQTIALGADSLDDAKLQLVEAVFALPLALEKAWKEKEADNAAATDKARLPILPRMPRRRRKGEQSWTRNS